MNAKHIVIVALLSVVVFLGVSCSLVPPDMVLRVVEPSYVFIDSGNNVRITFKLMNSGSETLENCKVRWYVDDVDPSPDDVIINYDEVTVWAPAAGVTIGAGKTTTSSYSVETTSLALANAIENIGIYEMGWNYSPDE
jgi:hypothetical protein